MEILPYKQHQELLGYLPYVKQKLDEWLLIDVRLTDQCGKNFTINEAADLVHALFKDKEGKLYICNDREILVLLHWGKNFALEEMTQTVRQHLPEGSCEVRVSPSTPEGLTRLEMFMTCKTAKIITLAERRGARRENIIIVADDDMYMRLLVKTGIGDKATVHEISNGDEVLGAYKEYAPNMVFLDIHLPGRSGTTILDEILAADPEAFVVMLSADSSRKNVAETAQQGAKGFLTKPITDARLQEYLRKCPTMT